MWEILVSLALVAGQGPGTAVPAPSVPAAGREARVLALLRELESRRGHAHHGSTAFLPEPVPGGIAYELRPLLAGCGSGETTLDVDAARQIAREVVAIYGVEADVRGWGADDVTVLLDTPQGERNYTVTTDRFRVQGDDFTPRVSLVGGLVDFLNAQTAGEDVELGAVLWEREARWILPDPATLALPEGVTCELLKGDYWSIEVEQQAVLKMACEGLAALQRHRPPYFVEDVCVDLQDEPWDHQAPVMLAFSLWPKAGPARPTVRVVQESSTGGAPWSFTADSTWLLLPRGFDLERPFTLELHLGPGSYSGTRTARVGVAARD